MQLNDLISIHGMKNILVLINLNGKEELLLEKAIEFAGCFKSKIWIIHIAAPDPDFIGYQAGPQSERDFRASELKKEHELIQEYSDKLKATGIDVEGLLIQGPTIDLIIEKTKKLNANLIIAGYQEHSFIYKAIIGSHSKNILKKSNIPVLLIALE